MEVESALQAAYDEVFETESRNEVDAIGRYMTIVLTEGTISPCLSDFVHFFDLDPHNAHTCGVPD